MKRYILSILIIFCFFAYADSIGKFDALNLRPGSLPSSGKNGELRVDSTDDNKLKKYNETSNAWEEITGSGGGSGGINFFPDFQADDTANVSFYDDTASATPTDGTGGTVNYFSVASETSNPLSGDASYRVSKTADNAQGEGFVLNIDTPDRLEVVGGKTVVVSFNYETSANYDNTSSGERLAAFVYRIGSNTLEACNNRNILTASSITNNLPIAPDGGQFLCEFTFTSSDTDARIILHQAGTGMSAYTIDIDRIKIGPDQVINAPIESDWRSYTPTASSNTNISVNASQWKRVGDSLHVKGRVTWSGAGGSGDFTITLPSGLLIDTAKLEAVLDDTAIGYAMWYDNGTDRNAGNVIYFDQDQVGFAFHGAGSPFTGSSAASGDELSWEFIVPIESWDSGAVLSTTQINHSVAKVVARHTSATSIPNSSLTKVLNWGAQGSDEFGMIDTTNSRIDLQQNTCYFITAQLRFASMTSGIARMIIRNSGSENLIRSENAASATNSEPHLNGSTRYCTGNSTDYIEMYAQQTSGSSVNTTASGTSATNTFMTVTAEPNYSTFAQRGVFEIVSTSSSTKTPSATAHFHQHTGNGLTLTPGTWKLMGEVVFSFVSSNPAYTNSQALWAGANGADSGTAPATLASLAGVTVLSAQSDYPRMTLRTAGVDSQNLVPPTVIIRVTETSTVYLDTYADLTTAANARITVHATAERIK